jgi:hypothetical protein
MSITSSPLLRHPRLAAIPRPVPSRRCAAALPISPAAQSNSHENRWYLWESGGCSLTRSHYAVWSKNQATREYNLSKPPSRSRERTVLLLGLSGTSGRRRGEGCLYLGGSLQNDDVRCIRSTPGVTKLLRTESVWIGTLAGGNPPSARRKVDGVLKGKRYVIHDRDPLFGAEFLKVLSEAGVASVKMPPQSPNLNA